MQCVSEHFVFRETESGNQRTVTEVQAHDAKPFLRKEGAQANRRGPHVQNRTACRNCGQYEARNKAVPHPNIRSIREGEGFSETERFWRR